MADRKYVLITGASKGIGRATALYLGQQGYGVFGGVRNAEDGEALRAEGGGNVRPVQMDVTDPATLSAALQEVEARIGGAGLHGLVNNAGIVMAAPLEGIPLEDFRRQLDVNIVGVLAVTQLFIPLLRRGPGRIINMSSINGRVAVPFTVPYAVSKFGLEALSDGFRMELRRWRIPVSVIQPGAIETPIWKTSAERAAEIIERLPEPVRELYAGVLRKLPTRGTPPKHALPPLEVARVIHEALEARRPKTRYLIGWDARIAAFLRRLLSDKMMDRIVAR